jgi:hypothetical protein
LVRAACFDAIPIDKADSYLGKLIKKYVPSAKSLPTANSLREKFLFEVFDSHVNKIKNKIQNQKISLIIDESPDFMGRPALNVLTSFFDFEKKEKKILLLKTAILKNTTSTYISGVLSRVLSDFDKSYEDVIVLCSDSAEYMKKLFSEIKLSFNSKIQHITDVSHLIHNSVMKALNSNQFIETKSLLVKIGAIFRSSNKVLQQYTTLLNNNNIDSKVPSKAIESRWWALLKTAKEVKDQWEFICEFFDKFLLKGTNETKKKVSNIIELLGDEEERRLHFIKITFMIECFDAVEKVEKKLEVSEPNIHLFYELLNVKLENTISDMKKIKGETGILLKTYNLKSQNSIKKVLTEVSDTFEIKWTQTVLRNLDKNFFGKDSLFNKCMVFNPFSKCALNQDYSYYLETFNSVIESDTLESEFNEYMKMDIPDNKDLKIIDYWISLQVELPTLSKIALTYLGLSCGSCDVERSFSKFRNIQTIRRCRLSDESLNIYSILNFNGDIEDNFFMY